MIDSRSVNDPYRRHRPPAVSRKQMGARRTVARPGRRVQHQRLDGPGIRLNDGSANEQFDASRRVLFAEFVEQEGPGQRRGWQVPLFGRSLDRIVFGLSQSQGQPVSALHSDVVAGHPFHQSLPSFAAHSL